MKILPILVIVCIFYGLLAWFARRSVFYPMPYPAGYWEAAAKVRAEDVFLTTSDGIRIHGWWVPAKTDSAYATLHLHGNAGNITHRWPVAQAVTQAGSAILLLDYRGYGRSEGKPSEAGIYRDADAGYDFLRSRGFPPDRIVVHGESLGTVPAIELATRKSVAGVVLEAPFPSARAVAARILPVLGPLLISGLDSKARIVRVNAPKLFLHGDQDEVIAYKLGRDLYAAATEPKQFRTLRGAHHNDMLDSAGVAYVQWLEEFYADLRAIR